MEKVAALAIRQPYAEQILRGQKRIEYRSRGTHRRGCIYIYASKTPGDMFAWMDIDMIPGQLPTGVLVGTVEIHDCTKHNGEWHWHLVNPKRLEPPVKPTRRPNVTWFDPF